MNMQSKYRSNLYKAKGLGSAGEGSHHWLYQRFTAVALTLMTLWLICFCYQIAGKDTSEVIIFLQRPYNLVMLILFELIMFYHAALGMQVVIEDYVSCRKIRVALIFAMKIFVLVTIISLIVAFLNVMNL